MPETLEHHVEPADAPWRIRATLPTLVAVSALVTIVTSLGAPVIPAIARADHVSLSTGEWVLTSALIVGAVATPAMGRFADGSRQRRVVEVSLGLAMIGCTLSAISPDFVVMVLGRSLQGVGFGLLPVTITIARRTIEATKVPHAVATLAVTAAVGAGLGYPLTGIVATHYDFRVAYGLGAVLMALGLVMAVVVLPTSSRGRAGTFDVPGWLLLAGSVLAVTVALSQGGEWGWTSPAILLLFGLSVVVGFGWVRHQLRVVAPLIDIRMLRHRAVLTANIGGLAGAVSMYLFLPVVVEFAEVPSRAGYGFGASVFVSGCSYLPLAVGSFVSSRGIGLYERHFGARSMVPCGLLIFAVASGLFAVAHGSLWEAYLSTGLSGLGLGFSFAALPGLIVKSVPARETGAATGLYAVGRSVGLSLGSALAAAILSAYTHHGDIYPAAQGFSTALIVGAAVLVVTAVAAYMVTGRADHVPMDAAKSGVRLPEEAQSPSPTPRESPSGATDPHVGSPVGGLCPGEHPGSSPSDGGRMRP